jgi:hypothetical protein
MLANRIALLAALSIAAVQVSLADTVIKTTANNGNLVMEDVPPIPGQLVETLNRYQNVRSAGLTGWTEDGNGIYVTTRFGDLNQLHRVNMPGGARRQLTFFNEPVYGATRRPGGSQLIFTRDAGGNEFAQVFAFDPATGDARMLTDGESRNGAVVWDRQGRRIAYQSTMRNGASNDVWAMDPDDPDTAEIVLESPDGSWWGPAEFSERTPGRMSSTWTPATSHCLRAGPMPRATTYRSRSTMMRTGSGCSPTRAVNLRSSRGSRSRQRPTRLS